MPRNRKQTESNSDTTATEAANASTGRTPVRTRRTTTNPTAGGGAAQTRSRTRAGKTAERRGASVEEDGVSASQRTMSSQHREALKSGRNQTKAVRSYLEALETSRPRRGPRPNPTKMRERIAAIDAELADAAPLERVNLHQERMDVERQLEALEQRGRLDELEQGFVDAAVEYSQRHGLSPEAWLAAGVPRDTLKRAGLL